MLIIDSLNMAEPNDEGCAQTAEKLKLIAMNKMKRMQTPKLLTE